MLRKAKQWKLTFVAQVLCGIFISDPSRRVTVCELYQKAPFKDTRGKQTKATPIPGVDVCSYETCKKFIYYSQTIRGRKWVHVDSSGRYKKAKVRVVKLNKENETNGVKAKVAVKKVLKTMKAKEKRAPKIKVTIGKMKKDRAKKIGKRLPTKGGPVRLSSVKAAQAKLKLQTRRKKVVKRFDAIKKDIDMLAMKKRGIRRARKSLKKR